MKLSKDVVMDYQEYPERIIQFGEGNFLRAFVDWMVHQMNEKVDFNTSVVVVQPIEKGMIDLLNEQNGLYTLVLKGLKNGIQSKETELIQSISRGINPYTQFDQYLALAENSDMRFIVSNTTEAGIAFSADDTIDMAPPKTFPGKLTRLLYHRFKIFGNDKAKGFILLPCELIDRNGDELKKMVLKYSQLWNLGDEFISWINEANVFCNTLVDRIVPGYSPEMAKEIETTSQYSDQLVVEGEPFHLWVIEGPEWISHELPTKTTGLNVLYVNDMTPYRTRKVRILNGAHTVMTPVAFLYGIETVREAVENPVVGLFVTKALQNEIIPTLDLPKDELLTFSENVNERFLNPFVKHALLSISLNSVSKYKARVLPSLKEYQKRKGKLPVGLSFSLASMMVFYRGKLGNTTIPLKDDDHILALFASLWNNYDSNTITEYAFVETFLADQTIWGENLNKIPGLTELVASYVSEIVVNGMNVAIQKAIFMMEENKSKVTL
jgi:tagaturonate reductase